MNIRPRNIPKFQTGGVPQWYLDRYGNRTSLLGWNLNKRYNYANQNLNTNDHRNAGNLDKVYSKNIAYIGTPGAISSDIQSFYNSDGNGMSAEDFVNFYNQNAAKIRNHWALNLTYNAKTAGEHNRLFKKMFQSRSNQSQSPGSDYNIGYLNDLEDIEGSSTWLRRMDLYENEFDENNPDLNRLHQIKLKDGSTATVYKKANGDIGLFNQKTAENSSPEGKELLLEQQLQQLQLLGKSLVLPQHLSKYGFDWGKIASVGLKIFGNPELYAFGRLAGNLLNNERVYDELLKGIKPALRQTYNTYRQVVGDEATKQGFYRRAALGETKAAQPFTSDADRQMVYLYEAKRIGDELRALGDLADNLEIRRTSDESNQHLWANTQRATEVANANIASINQANALRHNLLALKHSAQWSSIDNYLKSIEYRKRQKLAEDQELEDLLWALSLEDIQYTPEYAAAYKKYNDVLEKHKKADNSYDQFDPEVMAARGEFLNFIKEQRRKLLLDLYKYRKKRNLINYYFAKSGGKITRKRKDDLLYKSTRDVVEHFRKISKISSDALNRRKSKIERLAPHPTKKYLQGGVAPFTVFTPIALGGETTRTQEYDNTSRSSRSSTSEKSSLAHDLLKELFKSLAVEGLPSDVNGIYAALNNLMSRQKAFGNELSTEDIASMYILQMLLINNVKYFKSLYDLAKKIVNDKNANSEFAIDIYGRIAALNRETAEIEYLKPNELDISKYNPLTNLNLLDLRATTPSLAYNNEILRVAANATSMEEIGKFLKAQLPKVESSESVIEGYTKKDSNLIKEGIRELLQEAPEGDYKYSVTKKSNSIQRLKALNYLYNILPDNMKTLLNIRSGNNGKALIEEMIGSEAVDTTKYEFDAITGKAAKDANGKGNSNDLEMNNALRLLTGAGGSHLLTFGIGNNNVIQAYGRQATIADTSSNESAFGADFSYNDIYKSGVGRILDLDNASFGDVPINKAMKDSIIVDNSKIVGIDLPYKTTRDGRIIPDFDMLKRVEEADLEILNLNLDPNKESDISKINQIYADKGLPIKYGGPTKLTGNYMRFAVIQATASEDAFLSKEGLSSNKTLTLISDDNELEKYVRLMLEITKDKKYSLDKPGIFSYGDKDVYKGSIFIPITGNITDAALGGGGSKIKTGINDNYDIMNKTWYTRNYIAPLETNFNK